MPTLSIDERNAIRESFSRLLVQEGSLDHVRAAMETPEGFDRALWRRIAELGVTGLLIDADHGGSDASAVELELLMEEAGAALLCAPLMSSAVLAAGLLSASTDDEAKGRLLPDIASGERIATVALTDDGALWTPATVGVRAVEADGAWRLSGIASFVTYGAQADALLVVARTPDGLRGFEVAVEAEGLSTKALQAFDLTQRFARLTFDGAAARRIAGVDEAAIERVLDLARVALAGEQAGAARRIFDITMDYIKTRVQFGRPVGGFQAIKHIAADLLVEVESATSAARHAAAALADGAPDREVLINLAAFACADAFSQTAATALQMHGGIGFTWSNPCHLYLRRARADAKLFGDPDAYRDRYLAALELKTLEAAR